MRAMFDGDADPSPLLSSGRGPLCPLSMLRPSRSPGKRALTQSTSILPAVALNLAGLWISDYESTTLLGLSVCRSEVTSYRHDIHTFDEKHHSPNASFT